MARFKLDAEQTDAILELKIYRLARLEILVIQQELAEKRKRAKEIGGLLKRDADLWKIVRAEIEQMQKTYGDARRSEITGEVPDEEYTADDFIIDEDNVVIVTRDGWVKRQKEVKDIASTRVREGDAVLAVRAGQHAGDGRVLHELRRRVHRAASPTCRRPPGYGEPIQSLFKFKDGEKVVGALSLDPRTIGDIKSAPAKPTPSPPPPVHALGRDERRLQPAVLARAVRRAEHARGPPVRARRRRRGDRRRRRG